MKYSTAYLSVLLLLLGMLIVQHQFGDGIDPSDTTARVFLLVLGIGGLPLVAGSVRDGEVSLPPYSVSRRRQPVLFWLVIVANTAFCVALTVITLRSWNT